MFTHIKAWGDPTFITLRTLFSHMVEGQTIAEDEPLSDLPDRLSQYGEDEQGRRQVNSHGDVDVVRTPEGNYPVQLPLEPGAVVTIDGKTEVFAGFHKDALQWTDEGDTAIDGYVSPTHEGVHAFNTRVRNATEVSVEYPEA